MLGGGRAKSPSAGLSGMCLWRGPRVQWSKSQWRGTSSRFEGIVDFPVFALETFFLKPKLQNVIYIRVVTLGAHVCILFTSVWTRTHFVMTTDADRIWETVAVFDSSCFLHVQGGAGRSQLWRAMFAAGCEIPCRRAAFMVKGQMWLGDEASRFGSRQS